MLHGVAVGPPVDQESPKKNLGLERISSDDRASIFMILDFTAHLFLLMAAVGCSGLLTIDHYLPHYLNCHRVHVYR